MKKINMITLCSGYDSQAMAMTRLCELFPDKISFDLVAWSEIDKYACQSHDLCFPQYKDRNVGDMTKVDWSQFKDKHIDLLFYSTPCQSVSMAGKRAGLEKDSGTRSSIIWATEHAIKELMPDILCLENVPGMLFGEPRKDFYSWYHTVESYGYKNFFKVINAKSTPEISKEHLAQVRKEMGEERYEQWLQDNNLHEGAMIPQNRDRVFMVSFKDNSRKFFFPDAEQRLVNLKDVLQPEEDVNKEYWLDDSMVARYLEMKESTQENNTNDYGLFSDLD